MKINTQKRGRAMQEYMIKTRLGEIDITISSNSDEKDLENARKIARDQLQLMRITTDKGQD